ncbi:hypothetical protein [Cyclobacterium jeungdonense]|uniref:Lipocalin-like domain-containing protein n=1 Tax=Cyclobacterium jeungdonense TaxID=708087 RepID=A0ABT8CAK6_9BACT|nr:hypothetical protein [Cyclobacterium jeungdonense]MDN3688711.1 hypothetical protein [Cyclobacterium jeungdonense]
MRVFTTPFFFSIVFLLQISCTPTEEKIQGNWILQSQELLNLKSNTRKKLDPPDFKLLSIIGDTLYLDTQKCLYSFKDDELVFSWDRKICRFEVVGEPANFMALISKTYDPDGITTIYFKRHEE